MRPRLHFPPVELRIQNDLIWDPLRRKWVSLTPEEWVRQHLIAFLTNHLSYSVATMNSEHVVHYNGQRKRCDVVCFNRQGKPLMIAECKAPDVEITLETFIQISKYANTLKAPLLVLSNGLTHFCALIKPGQTQPSFLENIPGQRELAGLIG